MESLEMFLAQAVLSILLSAAILLRLQSLMRRIGNDVCEEGGRATEFWISYTQLMMVIAPLLFVTWVTGPALGAPLVTQLKSALATVLFGQFVGLVLVGRAVWNAFVRKSKAALSAVAAVPAKTVAA
jgi:small-conductance mechanosensitive channel